MSNDTGKTLHEQNADEYGYVAHTFDYGSQVRRCTACGEREAAWDDEEYPIDPCITGHVAKLATMVEDELDDTYDLVYVDHRDGLTDEQVGWLLEGDWGSFYDSTMEFESDQQYHQSGYEVDDLAKTIANREWPEFSDRVLDEFSNSDARESLTEQVRERDNSDWVNDLIRNTAAPLMRVLLDTPHQDPDGNFPYGWIATEYNESDAGATLDLGRELGIDIVANRGALDELQGELTWPDHLWPFLVFRPTDLRALLEARGDDMVVITNPHVWLTNIYQGNGHMVQVKGEYRVKRSDIMTDDSAPGYSADEVMGLVHSAMDADVRIEKQGVAGDR